MSANTPIGAVDKFIFVTSDQLENPIETVLNKNFVTNQQATYQQVYDASLALASLSKNTYRDTICVTNISTNEEVAG